MPTNTTPPETIVEVADSMRGLATLPDWLVAATNSARLIAAIKQHVPEFRSGELVLRKCELDRLRLKGGRWEALYELQVDGPGDQRARVLMLEGLLTPPQAELPAERPGGGAFGTDAWFVRIPDLRLDLWMYFTDVVLDAMPLLTDADQARAFLEQSIRACSPNYADLTINNCALKIARYKPGSRCTVLYRLGYDPPTDRWPDLVVAKTYSRDKGQNAYEGMSKLWASPLSRGDVVSIAEPLAYAPEHKVLVQGPVRGDRSYKDLLRDTLRAGTHAATAEIHAITRKVAAGLAALHHSGARHGETVTWEDELAEIQGEVEKLSAVDPRVRAATEPLLARLVARAAQHPADPTLPAHRSFRPQQVQIDHGAIGFIDFDGFCLAEPALDIALFNATLKEMGINTSPSAKQKEFTYADAAARLARLGELQAICDTLLDEYARHAPISRERVALWESLDLLTVVLRCWSKVKPHQLDNAMVMLETHLQAHGLAQT